MRTLVFTSLSGWMLLALVAATTMLPYTLRSLAAKPPDEARPLPRNLRPHYWLAYAIALVSFGHAWAPMSAGWAGRFSAAGLYAATGGWLLIYIQIFLGRTLRSSKASRSLLRRWHFWVMVSIVTLVLVHIALNSLLVQAFF